MAGAVPLVRVAARVARRPTRCRCLVATQFRASGSQNLRSMAIFLGCSYPLSRARRRYSGDDIGCRRSPSSARYARSPRLSRCIGASTARRAGAEVFAYAASRSRPAAPTLVRAGKSSGMVEGSGFTIQTARPARHTVEKRSSMACAGTRGQFGGITADPFGRRGTWRQRLLASNMLWARDLVVHAGSHSTQRATELLGLASVAALVQVRSRRMEHQLFGR
jgi:hypothetical protein